MRGDEIARRGGVGGEGRERSCWKRSVVEEIVSLLEETPLLRSGAKRGGRRVENENPS